MNLVADEALADQDRVADGDEFRAVLLVEVVQERHMLVGVQVQVAFGQGLVGRDIVREFHDFHVQALFFRLGRDGVDDFGMGAGRGADFQGLAAARGGFLVVAAAACDEEQDGEGAEEYGEEFTGLHGDSSLMYTKAVCNWAYHTCFCGGSQVFFPVSRIARRTRENL